MFANHAALRSDADPDFERPSSFWRLIGPVRDSTNHGEESYWQVDFEDDP